MSRTLTVTYADYEAAQAATSAARAHLASLPPDARYDALIAYTKVLAIEEWIGRRIVAALAAPAVDEVTP